MFIGFTYKSLELCITIAALYSTSTMLFGGFYSNTIPIWLNWLRYGSIVYYGYLNMQMVEFASGPPISCAIKNSKYASCISGTTSQQNNTLSGLSMAAPSTFDRLNGMIRQEQNFIPEDEILIGLDPMNPNELPNPIWFNTLCLLGFLVFFRLLGYIILRIYHKPA